MQTAVALALVLSLPAAPAAPPASGPPEPAWDLVWMVGPRDDGPRTPPPQPTARTQALGRSLYGARCAVCHGQAGDGRGPLAGRVHPRPTDFTRGVFKLRSTPTGRLPTDEDLFRTLTRGMHGTAMQPWRELSVPERWALVQHLKTLSPRFREERPGPAIHVPPPPHETAELRARGERLYVSLRCGACHGKTGAGDGPGAASYSAHGERDVAIRDFTRGRFIRGAELEDVFLTLRAGLEGTPMGAYDVLRDDDVWALAAYVRSLVHQRPLHQLPPAGTRASEDGPRR
jgi:mono/diheme cytochrome c family protein